jgi:hypothetical protein
MALEQVGLQAVFDTKEFQRGQQIYDRGVKQANQAAADAASQSQKSAATVGKSWEAGFAKVATAAAAAVASFLAVQKAVGFMKEATMLAARVETLGVSLEVVGENAGYSGEQISAFEEAVKAQGITTQAARQSLLMMGQAQIDWTHAADLARIAQDTAVIANVNSSEAFEQLTYTIQSGSVVMARRLGLQVSFQRGYEQMAATLDKTTDELTEEERVQARVNTVIQAGSQVAGTYEAAMGTAGKQALSLARYIEEITLSIGRVGLGAFSVGIEEITRLLRELRQWIEDNEEQLEDLGEAVTMLAGAMVDLAGLDLPVEDLTAFVEDLTTLVSILAVGIETVSKWNTQLEIFGEQISAAGVALDVVAPGLRQFLGLGKEQLGQLTEIRKENEALFLTEKQIAENVSKFREPWVEIAEAEAEAAKKRQKADEEAAAAAEEEARKRREAAEKVAETMTGTLTQIADAQRDHDRKLADMADDHFYKQERAWQQYEKSVAKEIQKGQKAVAKIEEKYQEQRAKALADYAKSVAEVEKELAKDIARAQADFQLRERQARERYNLDRVQGERRYQYERSRLVAEGDTLALEELEERHKLEQQEAEENEKLRRKQAEETQAALVEAMEAAGRAQAEALAGALAEQFKEMEEQSRKEKEEQQQTNRDRLQEMADSYAEGQRLADEDYQRSLDKANQNYQQQQEDLGRNLARQEDLQELSGEQVAKILDQYYGESGISERIMGGYFDWLEERAIVAAKTVAAAMSSMSGTTTGLTGGVHGMQEGGILTGPATAYVEPGVTEAFIPLGRGGGGYDLSWSGGPIPIAGLERGSPADVNAIARALARSLTEKIRARRRG